MAQRASQVVAEQIAGLDCQKALQGVLIEISVWQNGFLLEANQATKLYLYHGYSDTRRQHDEASLFPTQKSRKP